MNAVIVYHRVDYDGLGSMLVANTALSQDKEIDNIDLFGWNYGDTLPDVTNDLGANYDIIVMVDISFPPEVMLELKSLGRVGVNTIWIDHHITAINDSIKFGYDDLDGIRFDGKAAIENTWEYFFPGIIAPPIVQLLGTYDVWNKERFDWENLVLPLQFALKAKYSLSVEALSEAWPELCIAGWEELKELVESGKLILSYLRSAWRGAIKRYSWEVTVGGKYRGIACTTTEFSSNLFGEKAKEYDVMISICWDPSARYWRISMYSDPSFPTDFHCGEYLKAHYNGGGHKGAGGGQLNQEQYLRLINDFQI